MQFVAVLFLATTILQYANLVHSAKDSTLEPNTSGKAVVEAVIFKLKRSAIFPEDRRFLTRIAYVESKFGLDPNTYRPGYFGGIWQVDKVGFQDTQNVGSHPGLLEKITQVEFHFGIKWLEVNWEDLVKPLYSGIAARLFLTNVNAAIPETIKDQAIYWKTNYNKNGAGTVEKFVADITELEGESVCNANIDIVAALDGSGSVDPPDFKTGKEGVAHLLTRFNLEKTKFGYIVFGNHANVTFPLQSFSKTEDLENEVLKVVQPSYASTQTDEAINAAVMMLSMEYEQQRVKTLAVFTDGNSNDFRKTERAAKTAYEAGITTFSIGIGTDIGHRELLTIAADKPNHVFAVNSFDTLVELVYSLNSEACSIPQEPNLDETIRDSVVKDEIRYFTYPILSEGITIRLNSQFGKIETYHSTSVETPSSALNDGELSGGNRNAFIPAPKDESVTQVYVAVQGLEDTNTFTIQALEGDHSGSATIRLTGIMIVSTFYVTFQSLFG